MVGNSIRDVKRNLVVDLATQLFLERGIAAVTIKDIALQAGVGEATVYRYFAKKQNIVVVSAVKLEKQVFAQYFDVASYTGGYRRLEAFYNGFLRVFEQHPEFYRFVAEFDASVAAEEDLQEYEMALVPFYEAFVAAYRQGVDEGTVCTVQDIRLLYLTTTHALLGLCKKIAIEGKLLKQDVYGKEEIQELIALFLHRLRA